MTSWKNIITESLKLVLMCIEVLFEQVLIFNGVFTSKQMPAPLPICRECLGATASSGNNNNSSSNSNATKRGSGEKLSRCSVCGAALHNSCAPAELSLVVERGATWLCDDCSPTCAGCQLERESQNYLVKCSVCPKCYHPGCLDPALDKKSKAPWRCRHCQTAHTPSSKDNENKARSGKSHCQQQQQQSADSSSRDDGTPTSTRKRLSKIRENRK